MPLPRNPIKNEEDPEILAEQAFEKEEIANGVVPTAPTPPKSRKEKTPATAEEKEEKDAKSAEATRKSSIKKALRKKRSRGVSGSSIKKDGGRFEMGMENRDQFDDVSDFEDDQNYADYEKYVSDNYSSTGFCSDSEYSNDSTGVLKPVHIDTLTRFCSALEHAISDEGSGDLGPVAELLMDEYDETARISRIERALTTLTEDMRGVVVANTMSEYRLVSLITRLVGEGLLNKHSLCNFVANSDEKNSYPVILLGAAANLVESTAPETRGEMITELPAGMSTLAKEMAQEVGDACDIASRLNKSFKPYFFSHFVHQVCIESINSMNMDVIFFVTGALRDMVDHNAITLSSVRIGFARFFEQIKELEVDLPGATSLANLLVSYAMNDNHLIDEDVYARCPKPKRFLLKKANSCGRLSILETEKGKECNETNYFIMEN